MVEKLLLLMKNWDVTCWLWASQGALHFMELVGSSGVSCVM